MPFIAPKDVGTTPRRSLSAHRRLQAWERTKGVCVICETPIDGVRERWIVEHIRALELGGADDLENMGPAHEGCARAKTRDDHAFTARAKRQKILHLGAATTSHPLPGSRGSPLKRKINGQVVLRAESMSRLALAELAAPVSSSQPLEERASKLHCPPRDGTPPGIHCMANSESMRKPTGPDGSHPRSVKAAPKSAALRIPASHVVLAGEEAAQYEKLHADIASAVGPTDIIEEFWVRDVADLVWETLRLRRLRGALLQVAMRNGLERVLPLLVEASFAERLAEDWFRGENQANAAVDTLLADAALSFDTVKAEALAARLDDFERFDRLIANAEARRNAILREVDRHREALAVRLARIGETIIEAEFTDVNPQTPNVSPSASGQPYAKRP
ncbi:HNH endonuclease [Methylobacterium sp. 17Sr1-1]|uniref:HNH endonuclease n=1 Tax=Methylobacterium sp. 17Sr1-1 TaxID=2202826 RepID=UPI000D6EE6D2|nr:HNH endonuclease [Methylobacterium sp. 17Sr1-1]AWN52720.1 hypothetical protein DK412_14670 [Methylobacterium sp. 17Sr1-1]